MSKYHTVEDLRRFYRSNRESFFAANRRAVEQDRRPVFGQLETEADYNRFVTESLERAGMAKTPENYYSLSCDLAEMAGENADS